MTPKQRRCSALELQPSTRCGTAARSPATLLRCRASAVWGTSEFNSQTSLAIRSRRSGVGRKIQKDLDIAEYTDPDHNPMIPHTIVLEPGLVIYKIYVGYWFFGRPTVEELRHDLRAMLKKCRPDWDITMPELKAAWQGGRKELFYPYGKTFAETIREQD